MQTVTTKAIAKIAAVATGLAMATSVLAFAPIAQAAALTDAQVQSILSLLTSFGADSATIANVQASLTGGTPVSTGGAAATGSCSVGTANLTIGSSGAAVTCLQQTLIAGGYSIPAGATGYFGAQTRSAVSAWQTAKGISPTAGYFGSISRAAFVGTASTGGTTSGTTPAPVTAGTGNGLKVMLATDSPNNIALVQGQAIGSLAKFTFANPTASDIKVTNLAFKRIGVSNDSTLSNVYLYNEAKRLTDSAGVSNTAFNFNDPTALFTVPAGQTYTVSVLADIAGSTSGQQVGVQLTAVTSSGTLDSSVSLPVNGYTQTVSAATLATADFNTTTNPAVTTMAAQDDYTVWSNSTIIGTRAVKLESFQLRNIGSVARTDIQNFRLHVKGVQVGSAVASIASDDTVTFDFSANPVRIETGTAEIKVVADVIAGSGNTFQFSLRRASDARFVDTDLNQPILATRGGGSSFTARNATSATVDSGTVSTVKSTNSPSSNIAIDATNVKWATFELRAAGEDVKVESLDVQANTTWSAAGAGAGLDNGKVFLNGVQVGSTKDLTDATDVNFTFGSSMILKAGQTAIVDIYADAKSTTGASFLSNGTVAVTLGTGSSNAQGQKSLASINTPTSDVAGNTITLSSSTLTLTKYSGYGNQTLIAGTNNARLGSFTLSTGSTEGVNVNTLTVALSSDESATITDLILKDNATGAQIGTTKASPSTSNAFSVNVAMGSSVTKTIDIYGNIKSGSNAGPWIANIDASGTGAVTGSTVDADALNLQTITLGTADLAAANGVSPDNANVIAGASMVKVGTFNFTSQYSSFTVDKIAVKIPANAATSIASVTLRYPNASGVSTDSVATLALSSGAETHATATFTNLTFYIPADTTKKLDVYVSLATIVSGATSGSAVTVLLDAGEGYRETNSAGTVGTTLAAADLNSAATSGKGTMYVRKSVSTLSSTPITTTLTEGTDQVLGRVTVTADAAGDVDWGSMVFTLNKTSALTTGATTTVAVWSGSNQIAGSFATTTGALLGGLDACQRVTTCRLHFRPTTVETVAAGGSKTYELRGTVGGTAAGNNSIDVSIGNPQTSASSTAVFSSAAGTQGEATAASFAWSDWSDLTDHAAGATSASSADWMGDYLIKTLPLTIGTRSVSINS
ncbi:peptidoglycan-binding protein [Candidatus Kaiserbacteria bacterium]|nr:peptidoglycan-binding protein [Candidatus Kaiserbacteria bacterium]